MSEGGSRASFNRGKGISEIEGKVARGAMSEGGSRASFNRGNGFRYRRLKARWVAPSKAGAERVSIHLFHSVHSVRSAGALSHFLDSCFPDSKNPLLCRGVCAKRLAIKSVLGTSTATTAIGKFTQAKTMSARC